MKTVVNKTQGALRVSLPKGKKMHLGPRQTGQISVHDLDHPPLRKMLEAEQIEIVDEAGNEAVPKVGPHGKPPFEQRRRG